MRLDYFLAAMRYRIKAEGIYHLRIETLATRRGPIFIPLFRPRKKNRDHAEGRGQADAVGKAMETVEIGLQAERLRLDARVQRGRTLWLRRWACQSPSVIADRALVVLVEGRFRLDAGVGIVADDDVIQHGHAEYLSGLL